MNELLSVVVPVYNEENTVGAVIERLLSIDLPVAREILVVNDGSTDGTRGVLDALPTAGETLRIVHAPVNGGKGRAIRTGFEQARGTIVRPPMSMLKTAPRGLGPERRRGVEGGWLRGRYFGGICWGRLNRVITMLHPPSRGVKGVLPRRYAPLACIYASLRLASSTALIFPEGRASGYPIGPRRVTPV